MTTATTRTTTGAAALVPQRGGAPGGAPQHGDLGRLLVRCQDRPGIVSAVSTFLADAGANVVSLAQHSTAPEGGTFFQRTEFRLPALAAARADLERTFAEQVAAPFGMDVTLREASKPQRVAIMVSKTDHCALDLLWRHRRGELPMTIAMVISNHPDLAEDVRGFGVPFVHVPATRDTREQAEARVLELLAGNVDLVVLARYMQIITPSFLEAVGCPLINIHHSFLPAFIGAGPYAKAKERGVKLVGATAHYVTAELDEGPIIEQDVVRVGHQHDTPDLVRLGADVERAVLSRAVRWHLEDRVLRHEGTTVVL
ncbi:formyltetrahydrofolate deformylase [Quadrisphaera oryzae]|uniref:formyltetrahydrofolate deformylase n=1 Tax=Quadrisphaera TaxID=317661 RepID=UPI00164658FF|nr:formyltetrahydrofolate deformylase [Quadrisphaera sp. RL12-1S]MBC3763217.1 formyltetrahydrofolate deformylase [Quadrisphaera sp. RL12-1S]